MEYKQNNKRLELRKNCIKYATLFSENKFNGKQKQNGYQSDGMQKRIV